MKIVVAPRYSQATFAMGAMPGIARQALLLFPGSFGVSSNQMAIHGHTAGNQCPVNRAVLGPAQVPVQYFLFSCSSISAKKSR